MIAACSTCAYSGTLTTPVFVRLAAIAAIALNLGACDYSPPLPYSSTSDLAAIRKLTSETSRVAIISFTSPPVRASGLISAVERISYLHHDVLDFIIGTEREWEARRKLDLKDETTKILQSHYAAVRTTVQKRFDVKSELTPVVEASNWTPMPRAQISRAISAADADYGIGVRSIYGVNGYLIIPLLGPPVISSYSFLSCMAIFSKGGVQIWKACTCGLISKAEKGLQLMYEYQPQLTIQLLLEAAASRPHKFGIEKYFLEVGDDSLLVVDPTDARAHICGANPKLDLKVSCFGPSSFSVESNNHNRWS